MTLFDFVLDGKDLDLFINEQVGWGKRAEQGANPLTPDPDPNPGLILTLALALPLALP